MKRFLIFNLADAHCGEIGAKKNFVGGFATAKETLTEVKKRLFVEVYDCIEEKWLHDLDVIKD